ncbi:MAG TPA: tricarballylate utilization 4Fe-4S protein TcuB [Casimicrobiaceae bacterium]|nr:tricarballylate utilization 4Fe-4S protein TcuB [Casimicrobiaceae bacterium]
MQPLEGLAREAVGLAQGSARVIPIATRTQTENEAEAARVLQICNACRYCEGFCAVFPAMTRRLTFAKNDVNFLANLCHNCGACLHACQYAPPHEFAVNVPQAMARVRLGTYAEYAWPPALGALYKKNGLTLAIALAAGLALFLALAATMHGSLWQTVADASFYSVFPHNLMVAMFGPVFLYAAFALAIGARNFSREEQPGQSSPSAVGEAIGNALRLTYLDGGHRDGCNDEDDRFTQRRRLFHHLTFYGFLLCFAATCVATLYHYVLGWPAPYGYASLPKLLGISGGVALVIGTLGLFRLNLRRHPLQQDTAQRPMDRGFIALLFLTAVSGLVLMLVKQTPALAIVLSVHLGAVMALFLTLPYGKFAHAVYRLAALLKWSIERRQPSKLQLSDE